MIILFYSSISTVYLIQKWTNYKISGVNKMKGTIKQEDKLKKNNTFKIYFNACIFDSKFF